LNPRPPGYEDFVNCEEKSFSQDDIFNDSVDLYEEDDIELF